MSGYFEQAGWISNSFLKKIKGSTLPVNIERIFEFGSLVHACIFEPHLANDNNPDYDLACWMKRTFMNDRLCKQIMSYRDIKHEHEFYKRVSGLKRRCKADAWVYDFRLILEFKGLSITNERAFRDSITHFDYDMGAAWYIDTTGAERELIAGVSKMKPDKIFKYMVYRGDEVYMRGVEKYKDAIRTGLDTGEITDDHIYNYNQLADFLQ